MKPPMNPPVPSSIPVVALFIRPVVDADRHPGSSEVAGCTPSLYWVWHCSFLPTKNGKEINQEWPSIHVPILINFGLLQWFRRCSVVPTDDGFAGADHHGVAVWIPSCGTGRSSSRAKTLHPKHCRPSFMFELPVEGKWDLSIASKSCRFAWTLGPLRNNTVRCM